MVSVIRSGVQIRWIGLALVLGLSLSARAQTTPVEETQYCYGSSCYPNLPAAEIAMRASNGIYGPYLKQKKTDATVSGSGLFDTSIVYNVPDQDPVSINPPVYAFDPVSNPAPQFCAPSGDPTYPNGCSSQSEMVTNLIASEKAVMGATTATPSYSSSYFEPFSKTHSVGTYSGVSYGWLRHNRDVNTPLYTLTVTFNNPAWSYPRIESFGLRKFTSFICREGFVAKSGTYPGYDDANATVFLNKPTCVASFGEVAITSKLRQTCSKNDGNNPCYPATGGKARFETDFEFAGRPFVRSYHALRQAGQMPELAPGWVHSYSDRMFGNPSSISEKLKLVNDSGYIEIFVRIGSSSRFKSYADASRIIDVEAGNTFKLSDQGDLIRRFSAAGRLVKIESLASAWKIDFAYDGDRLASATDFTGSQLLFNYQNNHLASIRMPDGNLVNYAYDTADNMQSVQYADGTTRTYHYNEVGFSDANDPNALTGISDQGQRYDATTGLNYNVNRDYSPRIGRYMQSDPTGLKAGVSTYGYARSRPLSSIDPLGLEDFDCITDSSYSRYGCAPPPPICDCTEHKGIKIFTRDQADAYNDFTGDVSEFICEAIGVGIAIGTRGRGGLATGAGVGVSCGVSANHLGATVHEGDILHWTMKVCPDSDRDSGYKVDYKEWIEFK